MPTGDPTRGEERTEITRRLDGLRDELDDDGDSGWNDPVARGWASSGGFRFDESYVKHDLEALVLSIIALDGPTHGKGVMNTLAEAFDNDLSSGTVYPSLHDLEEAGLLERHELVRTKQYAIADEERALARLRAAMEQHRELAALLEVALEASRS
jgi:DNA-binding PadR family transcriptional regulator